MKNILNRIWTGIVAVVAGIGLATVMQIVGQMSASWRLEYLEWMLLAFGGVGFLLGALIGPRGKSSAPSIQLPTARDFLPRSLDAEVIHRNAPLVTAEELAAKVRTILQEPSITITPINPQYGSWNLNVSKGDLEMEFIWTPSRFGGTDMARPITPEDTPFDFADEILQSVDEALEYLRKLARKYG